MMNNFKLLSEYESNETWQKFSDLFEFTPHITEFPAIKTDKPIIRYDIRNSFRPDYPLQKLEEFAIELFRKITAVGERMYALDWQHPCYDFDPRKPMDRNEFNEWIIPVFPNGDYYIFLTKDFKNVWFGHPWEQTITIIGKEIVAQAREVEKDFPE